MQIYQPTDKPTYQFIDWLTDLPLYQPNERLTRSFLNTHKMSDWLTRQLINRLNWPTHRLTDWSTWAFLNTQNDWLTDWLATFIKQPSNLSIFKYTKKWVTDLPVIQPTDWLTCQFIKRPTYSCWKWIRNNSSFCTSILLLRPTRIFLDMVFLIRF